ncbi:acetate--CoA ligase family protein [Paralcaligenes ureilyticus]|uniref:Acyl-CoA synthetase (NDP forming) n=1 Tax=Paralcaligenes ureilyticus TaxID=627131 RepID=A0A4R3MCB5_9BURK|nr:acetate--CoA ligase family protein [Paralcaligenes ureilyticus]TCT09637.1 acyl-CoA synthetase (NDP forming) [Paralcaligenes ureilyticus]
MQSTFLNEKEGKALLSKFGVDVPKSFIADSVECVSRKIGSLTAPFVVKVVSEDILHKSDAGGVAINLNTAFEVVEAIRRMQAIPAIAAARIDGWLVEEMISSGMEVAIGGFYDRQFGPILMLGLGGIYIELLKDVTFRICPITEQDAWEMIHSLQTRKLLDGFRGGTVYDKQLLVQGLLKIGGKGGLFMTHQNMISELDINPLILTGSRLVAVDARIIQKNPNETREILPVGSVTSTDVDVAKKFESLFFPRNVAVLGASAKDVVIANTFIRRLKEFGFSGNIYPIHPKAEKIEGLKAYSNLSNAPNDIDYAYVAISAERVLQSIDLPPGKCKFIQIISSGFAETEQGRQQQEQLLRVAHRSQIRLLGPNCLGTYSPVGKLTFPKDAPTDGGTIGVVSQSGGLSTDIIKRGQWRGLRFSGLVTIGNSIDVTPVELLKYFLSDPATNAIGLYIEDIKDGRAVFDLLRNTRDLKPIVILRGGATRQGRLAAQSHTGALASGDEAWVALSEQTVVELVDTVDEFINVLLALQFLQLRTMTPTHKVVLFGNGGGSSVLGADCFARSGLDVSPFAPETIAKLEEIGFPPGTSVINPIDTPVRTLQEKEGFIAKEILDIVYDEAKPDAVAMHLNLAAFSGRGTSNPLQNLIDIITQTKRKRGADTHFVLALRSDRSEELDALRREYIELARLAGIPVYDEIVDMAKALRIVGNLERKMIFHRSQVWADPQ